MRGTAVEAIANGILTARMGRPGLTVETGTPLTVRDTSGKRWLVEVRAMPCGTEDSNG